MGDMNPKRPQSSSSGDYIYGQKAGQAAAKPALIRRTGRNAGPNLLQANYQPILTVGEELTAPHGDMPSAAGDPVQALSA